MNRRERPAANLQGLERWLTSWAVEQSMSPGRLRRRVGMIAIAAMIEQLNQPEPRFVFKGGAAFEFRFGAKARSSSDIDTIFRGNLDDAVGLLSTAIENGWSGFSGKVVDDGPFEVPGVRIPPRRAAAKLTYQSKAFVSVPIEIAAPEGRSIAQIDFVEIKPLHELGLEGPSAIAVLGAPYQIAQKLHACTTVATDGRPNDRAHDLADLILLDELTEFSLAETHAACVEIFRLRSMHECRRRWSFGPIGRRFGRRSFRLTRSQWWTSRTPPLVSACSSNASSELARTRFPSEPMLRTEAANRRRCLPITAVGDGAILCASSIPQNDSRLKAQKARK